MNDEKQPEAATDAKDGKPAEPADDLVTTTHSLGELRYTATTGRIVLREEVTEDDKFTGHKPKAELSITSYTLDDADHADRPVTFAFNGGPGSSSVWLHLGILGPRRVDAGDAGAMKPPPYRLVDNHESLLRHSDLVFIDPVSTGYSRAVNGEKAKPFHGYTGDIESVGEVIRLWTTRNNRWLSPKYLAGESYGTLRAAALSDFLQNRYGMYLNGLMLISPVLDIGTLEFSDHNDLPFAMYLPTYAAIAHYHGLHGDRSLREVLDEAEEFAAAEYPRVLARGSRLPRAERDAAVATIARLTGLSSDYVDAVDLRIEHIRFFTEVLRHKRKVVGRLDGRFTGYDADYGREHFSADPSMSAIIGPFTAALNHYVRAELEYENDLPYEVISRKVHPWSYKEFEAKNLSVADKLAAAMRANPHLRVHVACGYHDGATPHFAGEYTMARLAIPAELRDNVEFRYYEAGHMMYLHEESRLRQSRDLAAFVVGGE
ncbi:S10 family peptidase [Stackebrandtia nassauensis]|uniref:Peptidase S10 serine carboxypeptidase n=1 Tax=Stackebrandtia nassauensis (strain DSM 44728 / CIP 108903 / NRRL B-16338 / NBRC 102104 / LLR-40K-21) TaxID=446470 RepID=D3Q0E5_STANL|nr:peptidase S10 [Stackebrandtia nassauensis]ADD39809.1 peptidase S10 serine carboxypeptidase [Stackebrandtia nassauensis DSM 44728]